MEMVLLLSDFHVGKKTREYNFDVFKLQMKQLFDNFIGFKKRINKSYQIDKLKIVLLGDIVDGECIYKGQGYEAEMSVADAILGVVDELEKFIRLVLSRTEYDKGVDICCVYGNHGVANRHGSRKSNWDNIVYFMLRERLDDLNVNVCGDWFDVISVGKRMALITHGDMIRMYEQIPTYGINRNVLRWKTGGIRGDFDYVFMGHFHTAIMVQCNSVRVFVNGTMLVGDDYTMRKGLMPSNEFWAIIFDDYGDVVVSSLISSRKSLNRRNEGE